MDAGDDVAALDAAAVGAHDLDGEAPVEQFKRQQRRFQPRDHAGLTRRHHRLDPSVGRDDRFGGDIAGAPEILQQRGADDRLDQDTHHRFNPTTVLAGLGPAIHEKAAPPLLLLVDARPKARHERIIDL